MPVHVNEWRGREKIFLPLDCPYHADSETCSPGSAPLSSGLSSIQGVALGQGCDPPPTLTALELS